VSDFNLYGDAKLAGAYARLEFPGTYFLAYRDLPALFREHVRGTRALDFGCGAGRSTRFLRRHGFDALGVDISAEMIRNAHALDPEGDYRLVPDGDLSALGDARFDLVFAAFPFDNLPGREGKAQSLRAIAERLAEGGRFVNLVSSTAIYVHEWVSFTTRDYPANGSARDGDEVLIVNTAIADRRPVADIVWSDDAYRASYAESNLEPIAVHRPLGRDDEGIAWVNETRIAPWTIWVTKHAAHA
jgi:SAM-dependent methyltransferase